MSAEPGTLRPGGRTARVRTAVLRAAGDVLAEQGVDRLDLADVARRAEVGKTTVYRRWGSVTALVADLLVDMADQSLPRQETGSLLGDLRGRVEAIALTYQGTPDSAVAAELFEADRALTTAGRVIDRALTALSELAASQ